MVLRHLKVLRDLNAKEENAILLMLTTSSTSARMKRSYDGDLGASTRGDAGRPPWKSCRGYGFISLYNIDIALISRDVS